MALERLLGNSSQVECKGRVLFADPNLQATKADSLYNSGVGALSRIRGNPRSTRRGPITRRALPVHRRRRLQHI